MKVSYGIDVKDSDDPYITLVDAALDGFNEAAVPGAFWVDFFPLLKYIPSWFPGAGFKKKAAHWSELNTSVVQNPFNYVKEQVVGNLFFFRGIMNLFKRWFCRKMAMLGHR